MRHNFYVQLRNAPVLKSYACKGNCGWLNYIQHQQRLPNVTEFIVTLHATHSPCFTIVNIWRLLWFWTCE